MRRALLLGGVAFAIVWTAIAIRTLHLDDAIALSATAAALAAVARRRPWLATAALALAASAKPWAIVFLPLLLVPPGRRRWLAPGRGRCRRRTTWLPFVVDEPATLHATSTFTIRNSPSSALRALGIDDPRTPPWVRPVQFAAGLGVAAWLVWRRRWAGVVMAGLGVRLMIDPAVHDYYAAGLTLGGAGVGAAAPPRMCSAFVARRRSNARSSSSPRPKRSSARTTRCAPSSSRRRP